MTVRIDDDALHPIYEYPHLRSQIFACRKHDRQRPMDGPQLREDPHDLPIVLSMATFCGDELDRRAWRSLQTSIEAFRRFAIQRSNAA